MQSTKPTYKKPFEAIEQYEESTWLGNDTPIFETQYTAVFNDKFPCVKGHKLFIPKKNNSKFIGESYALAHKFGDDDVRQGKIDAFNIGSNFGIYAGQTIMWPHIHFIPRYKGDSKIIGGIRHAHPGADHRDCLLYTSPSPRD